MSLRRRLSILVAIALTPSLLLTGYNAVRWKIFLEDEARTSALSTARFASSEFEKIIDNSRQLMTAMAKYPIDFEHDEPCTAYFKSVIDDIPAYREAAIIDTNGKFHCSTIPDPAGARCHRPAVFLRALENRQAYGRHAHARPRHEIHVHSCVHAVQGRRRRGQRRDRSGLESGQARRKPAGLSVAIGSSLDRSGPRRIAGAHFAFERFRNRGRVFQSDLSEYFARAIANDRRQRPQQSHADRRLCPAQ